MSGYTVIVVGCSAGGLKALAALLAPLPGDFPVPLIVVQHIGGSAQPLVDILAQQTCLRVKEAEEKEPLLPGCVYVAPANYHLLVEKDAHLALSVDDKVYFSRPAIDVLFESAADAFGQGLIGVLLTGANQDGTEGCRCIKERGGLVIVQDPQTAEADTMPRSAIAVGVDYVVPLTEISHLLCTLMEKRS